MISHEAKGHAPHSEQSVDPDSYWRQLDGFLEGEGVSRLEHASNLVKKWDETICALPASLFDPQGAEGSRLWDTHILLKETLDHPQPFSQKVVEEVFPYWHFQLNEAMDAVDHARQYGTDIAYDENAIGDTVKG